MADIFSEIAAQFPLDEEEFKKWYAEHAVKQGLAPDPDDPRHFYDYRAAFAAGAAPDETGHWPSQFKTEGHPRMVIDGVNTKTGEPVGDVFSQIAAQFPDTPAEDLDAAALENYAAINPTDMGEVKEGYKDILKSGTTEAAKDFMNVALATSQTRQKGVETFADPNEEQMFNRNVWEEEARIGRTLSQPERDEIRAKYQTIPPGAATAQLKGFESSIKEAEAALPQIAERDRSKFTQALMGVTRFGAGMGVTALSAPAGAAVTFSQIYGQKYGEYEAKGVAPEQADEAAFATAVLSTPVETASNLVQLKMLGPLAKSVGVSKITPALAGFLEKVHKAIPRQATSLAGRSATASASESSEEGLQAYAEEVGDVIAENPGDSSDQLFEKWKARINTPEFKAKRNAAMEIGAIGGAVMVGAGSLGATAAQGYSDLRAADKRTAAAEAVSEFDKVMEQIAAQFPDQENEIVQEKRTAPETEQSKPASGQADSVPIYRTGRPDGKWWSDSKDYAQTGFGGGREFNVADLPSGLNLVEEDTLKSLMTDAERRVVEKEFWGGDRRKVEQVYDSVLSRNNLDGFKTTDENSDTGEISQTFYLSKPPTKRTAPETEQGKPAFLGGPEAAPRTTAPPAGPDAPEFFGGAQESDKTSGTSDDRAAMDDRAGDTPEEINSSTAAPQGAYAQRQRSAYGLLLPDLVEIAKEMNEGKAPKVVEELRSRGQFTYDEESSDIALRPDIAIGERIDIAVTRPKASKAATKEQRSAEMTADIDEKFRQYQENVKKRTGLTEKELAFRKEFHRPTGETHFITYRKDPTIAGKVVSHELGHLDDWYPDKTMSRGNILGSISKIKNHIDEYLKESPEASDDTLLTPADFARLRTEAGRQKLDETSDEFIQQGVMQSKVDPEMILDIMRGRTNPLFAPHVYRFLQEADTKTKKRVVLQAMKGMVDPAVPSEVGTPPQLKPGRMPTQKEINERFAELLKEEVAKRKLFEKSVIKNELQELSKAWKPYDEKRNPKYTAYRNQARELYGDAVSVMLTDPMLLREKAPTFAKAMDNYAAVRPEFSKALTDVVNRMAEGPEAMGDRILENQMAAMRRGNAELALAQKRAIQKVESVKDSVSSWLWDKFQPILKHVRQAEKSTDPQAVKEARKVRYDTEETQYIASEVGEYIQSVAKDVVEPLVKEGVTIEDLGAFLLNNHIIANREGMLNPGGVSSEERTAQMALDALMRKRGEKTYYRIAELAKRYRQIREESIIPRIEDSKIATPGMLEIIKGRDAYAKISIIDHLKNSFGGGVAGRFYHQVGSLKDAGNPFVFTILQDMSLLRAAKMNEAKTSTIDFLMDLGLVSPAEEKFDSAVKAMVPAEPKEPGKALMTIMRNGKPHTYVVAKTIADTFEYSPFEASQVSKIIGYINTPLRALLVSKNPVWMIRNVFRDLRTTVKNLPEARVKNLPKLAKAYKEGYGEAWRFIWNGDRSQDVKDMQKNRMLIPGRVYGTKEQNYDDEIERLKDEWQIVFDPEANKQAEGVYAKLRQFGAKINQAAENLGRVSEMGGKVAGYKFLNRMGTRNAEEIGHIVRTRIGTPDYKRQGVRLAHTLTNNFFMFSNVNKEGLRSAYESFREDKSAYVWKTIMYNVLPKLALLAAAREVPWIERAMKNLTRYQKTHYTVIPMGITEDENTLAFMIPEDYEGQLWGSLVYNMLEGPVSGEGGPRILDKGGVVSTVADQIPYRAHPLWNVGSDLWQYYVNGTNPVDEFRGKNVLPQNVYEVGGMEAAGELFKYAWNNLGPGSYFRLAQGELDKEAANTVKRVVGTPPLNSLFVLTNAGRAERYREAADLLDKADKARALKARRGIEEFINENGFDVAPQAQGELYKRLRGEALLPNDYTFAKFRDWYSAIQGHGRDEPRITALSYANSNKKKGAYLNLFSTEMEPAEFNDFIRRMRYNGLISADALVEMKKLQQKKE